MKPSDYSYQRFRVVLDNGKATTISMSWETYQLLLRKERSDHAKSLSRRVHEVTRELHAKKMFSGSLSEAVRNRLLSRKADPVEAATD